MPATWSGVMIHDTKKQYRFTERIQSASRNISQSPSACVQNTV